MEVFLVIKKLVRPTGFPTNEPKAEIEIDLVTVQTKTWKCFSII